MARVKQQKQIKAFLIEEFGKEKGSLLFEKQEEILEALIENIRNKSKNQTKTLVQTILPRIALYKALKNASLSETDLYEYMRKYILEKVGAQKHLFMVRIESIPKFYSVYSYIFLKITRTSDLWESTQKHGRDYFDVTMKKCLWHTACVENDCAELCRLFCEVDNITYGGLKKIGFKRTKTLGCGGDCCDFHFYKK